MESLNDHILKNQINRLNEESESMDKVQLPKGIARLENQVAGHLFDMKKSTPGMLRGSNGIVYKPGEKENFRDREISFYEQINSSNDPVYKELSNFTPKYYGTTEFTVMGKELKFLMLQDITDGMLEPCVMDVKIGKRTWDPLADHVKREREEQKYTESKNAYGFCIPGFQVYNLATGELEKYNKDYGKKLNAQTIIEAFKIFLNVTDNRPPVRDLVIKLLPTLWKISAFFKSQTKLRFYSSSLLIAYDAKRLRQLIRMGLTSGSNLKSSPINTRGKTFSFSPPSAEYLAEHKICKGLSTLTTTPLSSQIIKTNRRKAIEDAHPEKRSSTLSKMHVDLASSPTSRTIDKTGRNLDENSDKLCRTHSHVNNFERDMIEMKEDYTFLLQELTGSKNYHDWVRVNMIDFTHIFPAEEESIDSNYYKGIENIIKILESFL